MEATDVLTVLAAGLGAGIVIAAVGAGSLVSFPLLLGVGLTPLVANVCNTVGLVPGGLSGSYGFRRELAGKAHLVRATAITSALGALLGAALLLALPATSFESVVPWLVILAATLVAVQPVVSHWLRRHTAKQPDAAPQEYPKPLAGMSSLIGVYGGYFGAGSGVMMMAVLGFGTDLELRVVNALKTLAVMAANVVASLIFLVVADLDWAAIVLLAAGSVVGGYVGSHIGRRLPDALLRSLIVAAGITAAVLLLR